jgi:hypothetical protein
MIKSNLRLPQNWLTKNLEHRAMDVYALAEIVALNFVP